MRGFLPKYFSSEWSFAQFRVPETRTICAFGAEKNTIVGASRSYSRACVLLPLQTLTPSCICDCSRWRRRLVLQGGVRRERRVPEHVLLQVHPVGRGRVKTARLPALDSHWRATHRQEAGRNVTTAIQRLTPISCFHCWPYGSFYPLPCRSTKLFRCGDEPSRLVHVLSMDASD